MENNNEILETKTEEVAAEEIVPAKKKLPWWIFAIIGVAVVAVVAVVLILVLGGNKCEHIDKNDDFLCDECGAECDDGLEIITSTVTFELKDEAGAPMAGIKFTVKSKSTSEKYDLITGADGKASVTLPVGNYTVDYDYSDSENNYIGTIPEGFQANLPELRVNADTASVAVTVIDNNPNGSAERPYLVSDDVFAISIGAGEEIFYTCRVATFRKMKIDDAGIVVVYGEATYAGGEEFIITNDTTEPNFMASFSVKNESSEKIETEIVTIYEPGSRENPFIAEGNTSITVNLEKGETVYYKWTYDDRCILKATTSASRCPVKLSKIEIKVGENGEELEIPKESDTFEDDSERIVVYENEEIFIRISNESNGAISATITLEALLGE